MTPDAARVALLFRLDLCLWAIGILVWIGFFYWRTGLEDRARWAMPARPVPARFNVLDLIAPFFLLALAATLARQFADGGEAASATRSHPPETTSPAPSTSPPAIDATEAAVGAAGEMSPRARAVASCAAPAVGVLFLLVLGTIRVEGGLKGWGLSAHPAGRLAAGAIVAYLAVWPLCAGLLWLTRQVIVWFDPTYVPDEHTTLALLRGFEGEPWWVSAALVAGAALLAPLMEELQFRGQIQHAVWQWSGSTWAGVAASAVLFGAIHQPAETIPPLIGLGLFLGYLRAATGSLSLVILTHMVFNMKTLVWLALSLA